MGLTVRKILLEAYTADTTAEAAYTCPASHLVLFEVLTAHNIQATTEGIKVWVVPSGGAAGDTNLRINVDIPPYGTINLCAPEYGGSILLEAGDFLWVQALDTDDKVALAGHGWEEDV